MMIVMKEKMKIGMRVKIFMKEMKGSMTFMRKMKLNTHMNREFNKNQSMMQRKQPMKMRIYGTVWDGRETIYMQSQNRGCRRKTCRGMCFWITILRAIRIW